MRLESFLVLVLLSEPATLLTRLPEFQVNDNAWCICTMQTCCESQGRLSPMGPNGEFWLDNFSKKISLGFHIFIKKCPMVAVQRGTRTTDDRSGIVYALEHRIRGR